MKYLSFILTLLMVLLCTNCATLLSGNADFIYFESEPTGAIVYLDGMETCQTPCSSFVRRRITETHLEMRKEGYESQRIYLQKRFNTLSIINLAFVLGWGIDAATGALMEYGKKGYYIMLEKKEDANE